MTSTPTYMPLYGRIIITGQIVAKTGLHIGGNPSGIEIGGIDNIIIRNPISQLPYIPGSSLKGKMRSLYERYEQALINHPIDEVYIHSCSKSTEEEYKKCNVCQIFGLPSDGEVTAGHPTPLVVRDVHLSAIEGRKVNDIDDYTEVKWENAIDRITAQAVPRQIERVPAGAVFEEFELTYNIYSEKLRGLLPQVFVTLQLVEDDYLGGLGSRGSGKVQFTQLKVACKRKQNGLYKVAATKGPYESLETLLADNEFMEWLKTHIPIPVTPEMSTAAEDSAPNDQPTADQTASLSPNSED